MIINGKDLNVNLTYNYYDEEINKELKRFINKEKHKKLLEIFMILDEINKTEDIISFNYENNTLMVRVGLKDYYRINMESEV